MEVRHFELLVFDLCLDICQSCTLVSAYVIYRSTTQFDLYVVELIDISFTRLHLITLDLHRLLHIDLVTVCSLVLSISPAFAKLINIHQIDIVDM